MHQKTIAIYCFLDDFLKATGHQEDCRNRISDAEGMTAALLSTLYFYGNQTTALLYMHQHQGVYWIDKSQFNRRLRRLQTQLWAIFRALGQTLKELNTTCRYLLDSFPVAICDNIRIGRCRLLQDEAYRGCSASKRRYFYGFRVQVITTAEGIPVDFYMYAGAFVDATILQVMPLELPEGSLLYADSGYVNDEIEDLLAECDQIQFLTARRSNSKRQDEPAVAFLKKYYRRRIETVFSQIKARFPAKIHAVTVQGFLLKLSLFIMAFTFDLLTT